MNTARIQLMGKLQKNDLSFLQVGLEIILTNK
jgi:hypothetical protein